MVGLDVVRIGSVEGAAPLLGGLVGVTLEEEGQTEAAPEAAAQRRFGCPAERGAGPPFGVGGAAGPVQRLEQIGDHMGAGRVTDRQELQRTFQVLDRHRRRGAGDGDPGTLQPGGGLGIERAGSGRELGGDAYEIGAAAGEEMARLVVHPAAYRRWDVVVDGAADQIVAKPESLLGGIEQAGVGGGGEGLPSRPFVGAQEFGRLGHVERRSEDGSGPKHVDTAAGQLPNASQQASPVHAIELVERGQVAPGARDEAE